MKHGPTANQTMYENLTFWRTFAQINRDRANKDGTFFRRPHKPPAEKPFLPKLLVQVNAIASANGDLAPQARDLMRKLEN